jgi:high-affinity iron transporter
LCLIVSYQCCNPKYNGGAGWGVFNAILGWTNSATYGSVISYNLYWLFVILAFVTMRYREVKGHWPLMKSMMRIGAPQQDVDGQESGSESSVVTDSGSGSGSGVLEERGNDMTVVGEKLVQVRA